MIRVATAPIELKYHQAGNDMSHWYPAHYCVSDWFYMQEDDYFDKLAFSFFNMDLPDSETDTTKISDYLEIDSPYCRKMEELISKAGGQLWQFNAISRDRNDWVRQVVVLGGRNLYSPTWYNCYIKRPVLMLVCKLLNKTLYFKNVSGQKKWSLFLKGLREKEA